MPIKKETAAFLLSSAKRHERALPYQLRAKTTFELSADGLRCSIAIPVSDLQETA
jgi:galactose mutarotase-like enzyme